MDAAPGESSRPSKRPRHKETAANDNDNNNNDADNETDQMLQLLDGETGGFVDPASQKDKEAQQRRERRKQRLAAAAATEQQQQPMVVDRSVASATTNPQSNTLSLSKSGGNNEATSSANHASKLKDNEDDDGDDDEFDMFSSSVSPINKDETTLDTSTAAASAAVKRGNEPSDFDDVEGYYKAVIGETIELCPTATVHGVDNATTTQDGALAATASSGGTIGFKVAGVVGKGVFSTVLKCTTVSNTSSVELPPTTAMKCVRANEQMAKAAVHEIKFLQQLKGSRGVVPLLLPTNNSMVAEHRGHKLLVFPYMEFNLRDVLIKYGKGVGLSLQAVRSFFGQLLAAGTHLKKHGIIHADLKPDNILVSGDYGTVQLADFGSAFEATAPENQPTPYLVSRFYRAPEIILGLVPTIAIDLWSLAVTVSEIFLGDVLFRGKSNNEMLYLFMQHLGAFPNRVIRQHMVQCQKMPANVLPRQFQLEGTNFVFAQQTVDSISGEAVHKKLNLVSTNGTSNGDKTKFPLATPLHQKIMKARSASDSRSSVAQFSDLLQKCLALDPNRRVALRDALQHPFFQTEEKAAST